MNGTAKSSAHFWPPTSPNGHGRGQDISTWPGQAPSLVCAAGLSTLPGIAPCDTSASLGWVFCLSVAFMLIGAGVWSQLAVGWRWGAPARGETQLAMVITSLTIVALLALAFVAAVPVVWSITRAVLKGDGGRAFSASLATGAVAALVSGAMRVRSGWPGMGAHAWAYQGLAPKGAGSFAWALTLAETAYWAHPATLSKFPATQLVWMGTSPLLMVVLLIALWRTLHGLQLAPWILRFEALLGRAGAAAMLVFLAGALLWTAGRWEGPRGRFHPGLIDVAAIVIMSVFAVLAHQASRTCAGARAPLTE